MSLRNKMINLAKDTLIGPPKLTRFERARIVGARSLQVSLGAPILAPLPDNVVDPIDVAVVELQEKVLPMTIRRTLPEGSYQDIPLIDLLQVRVLN
jgi:DNA-directed RNA polymerase I, II, and III subunit RPABC2